MYSVTDIGYKCRDKDVKQGLIYAGEIYKRSMFLEKGTLDDVQYRALVTFCGGTSGLISGSAGNGKSFLLKRVIEILRERGLRVAVCASTGIAAQNLMSGANTIHSFVGPGWNNKIEDFKRNLVRYRRNVKRWKETQVLIIDEISMLSPELFEKFEHMARIARNCDLLFGGLQVICCGDWAQLPPIILQDKKRDRAKTLDFCFESEVFQKCMKRVFSLEICYRQAQDREFYDLLQEIRKGQLSKDSLKKLESRVNNVGKNKYTKLYAVKRKVIAENARCLSQINEPEMKYDGKYINIGLTFQMYEILKEKLKQSLVVEEDVILKKGAMVILTVNLDVPRGLANGSQGIIEDFSEEGNPVVRFINGVVETIEPYTWKMYFDDNELSSITFTQIPLILAFAITIHKSQSMTIKYVEVDLGSDIFEYGQAYTALSRCPSLDGLNIVKFNPSSILVHPKISDNLR